VTIDASTPTMNDDEVPPPSACCDSRSACIFTKALLARAAVCELAQRRAVAEREIIECPSPVARTNCGTLSALLHERARFTLRLPGPGQPLIHAQALRLQCGGLQGMQQALAAPVADVHRMVGLAHERHGSLTDLPWMSIVQVIAQWQLHRSRRAAPK
jgi:hypothetical protein